MHLIHPRERCYPVVVANITQLFSEDFYVHPKLDIRLISELYTRDLSRSIGKSIQNRQ